VPLGAGIPVPIRVEYYEQTGEAQAHLSWASPSVRKQTVPARLLSPKGTGTGFTEVDRSATESVLATPYPSPASSVAWVAYRLASDDEVRLDLYDILGRRVEAVDHGRRIRGWHKLNVEVGGLASGTYFLRLEAGRGPVLVRALVVKR
jgi:hypothetical protein